MSAGRTLRAKTQLAFYASTPAYRPVLESHGWDVGERRTALSKKGDWDRMAGLIDDEMLAELAVVAPWDEVVDALQQRLGGLIDRVGLYPGAGTAPFDPAWLEVVATLRAGP